MKCFGTDVRGYIIRDWTLSDPADPDHPYRDVLPEYRIPIPLPPDVITSPLVHDPSRHSHELEVWKLKYLERDTRFINGESIPLIRWFAHYELQRIEKA